MSKTIYIDGGVVSVEDAVKKDPSDQYSTSRRVRFELRFETYQDQEPSLEDIQVLSDQASAEVDRLLGRAPGRVTAQPTVVEETAAAAPKPTRTRKKADPDPAAVGEPEAAGATGSPSDPAAVVETPSDPAAVEPSTSADAAKVEADPAAIVDDWELPPEQPEVSDGELNVAVQKRNAELKNPVAIRELIATFGPKGAVGFQLRQIPQEKRHDFLAKLTDLK